jgi:hypothetical protein
MPDSSKPTDWPKKIEVWITAAFASIELIVGFIVGFREQWRLFTIVTVAIILGYIFAFSLYIFLALRKTRSKKNPWVYIYDKYPYPVKTSSKGLYYIK